MKVFFKKGWSIMTKLQKMSCYTYDNIWTKTGYRVKETQDYVEEYPSFEKLMEDKEASLRSMERRRNLWQKRVDAGVYGDKEIRDIEMFDDCIGSRKALLKELDSRKDLLGSTTFVTETGSRRTLTVKDDGMVILVSHP